MNNVNKTYLVSSNQFNPSDSRFFQILVFCNKQTYADSLEDMPYIYAELYSDELVTDLSIIHEYGHNVLMDYAEFIEKYNKWSTYYCNGNIMDY